MNDRTVIDEWAEVRARRLELVKAIAAELGGEAKHEAKGDESYGYLAPSYYSIQFGADFDHRIIRLSFDDKRLHIGGYYQAYKHGPIASAPSISVSATRDAKAIAKEIERRFLPGYEAFLAVHAAKEKEEQERLNVFEQSVKAIRAALGQNEPPITADRPAKERVWIPGHLNTYGHFDVNYGGSGARFQADLTLEQCIAVAKLLRGENHESS